MTREEASEAKARDEEARLWITGLEAVNRKIGVKAVFDLSATPFYLKGSGYPEGTLFPWVVSDFSLMDAIECGIVKIPRVPIADNAMTGDYPKYRNLWVEIREGLKNVRRGPEDAHKPPLLPGLLEGALKSLYEHYGRKFAEWEADEESRANGATPPVFIVVCNNTNVSKAVFDYIAGYETEHHHADGEPVVSPGAIGLFNNVENSAGCTGRIRSLWTAGSSNPARACPTTSKSMPRTRSRTSRPNTAAGSPVATLRT